MKKIITVLFLLAAAAQLHAAEWMTDLPKALEKAKAEKKHVLLDFTGSDWCPPCKMLQTNVLSTLDFQDFAQDNLILVELDFPHNRPQTAELKAANAALAEKYTIQGYPTIILLDADGNQLDKKVGYDGAKPVDFIVSLAKAMQPKPKS